PAPLGPPEAVAGRAAGQQPHHQVHAVREAEAAPPDLNEGARFDEAAKDRLELGLGLRLEREALHEVAYGDRLSEARHGGGPPAFRVVYCCSWGALRRL